MSELLQQVRVLDPISRTDRIADVLITDNAIQSVQEQITELPENTSISNCQGLILGPGLVDLYSHSGEPGFEERETIASLMHSAAAGGFTRVGILPDTRPPIDNSAVLSQLHQKTQNISAANNLTSKIPSPPHLYFWGAMTLGVQGQQMSELAELATSGIVGFADGQPIGNLALVRRLLEYLQPLGKPIALWGCDRTLAGKGVIREGSASLRLGLPGNPVISETTAIAALLEVIQATGTPVHLMRISTRRGVELIEDAKARGLPITASTTWMHLLWNTEAIGSYHPALHLEPPIGNPKDRKALIQGVKQGIIDAIAIDHTPYTYEEKTVAFAESPPGAIGLELALPLLWHNLVETGIFSAWELWRVLSTRPAECLQQQPTSISNGKLAELTLFDPHQTWTVETSTIKSHSTNTPYWGQQVRGRVVKIWGG